MATILTWDLSLLPPAGGGSDIVGGSIEAPKSLSGLTQAIDFSGGGFWQIDMKRVQLFNQASHRAWLQLRNGLNGGVGRVIVPHLNDILVPGGTQIPFSDGAVHSDGAGHQGSDIVAEVYAAAIKSAGTVQILVRSGRGLLGADVFSILHPTKNWRAYAVTDIDSAAAVSGGTVYTVGIRPTLREAITVGQIADTWRPRCLMRLPAGKTMAWLPEKYWLATPDVTLIEAMD